jgi:hypothetical protein
MLPDAEMTRAAEAVVRALTTAIKTLRLYPASSPIPLQAMQAASDALAGMLTAESSVSLVVARDGFTYRGERVNVTSASDLADLLTAHEVAQVDFLPGCTTADLSGFLATILREPAEVRAEGGFSAVLTQTGAACVAVSEVVLTTASAELPTGIDVDEFLRELAADEERLAAWLTAAAAGDPGTLSDGLAELARAAGPEGAAALAKALGSAFLQQETTSRDTLIGLALGGGEATAVVRGMLHTLPPRDFASSLADGVYAKNMLSMSNVLASLPNPAALEAVIEEIKPMLADGGHSDRELSFLGHMIEVRATDEPEPALADRQADYRTVATLSRVGDAELAPVHEELRASDATVNARTVNTMLSLLDQQQDFTLWSKTLTALASIVPRLLAQGELALADRILADLATRESRTTRPWPGLADHMQQALELATSPEAMRALIEAMLDDPSAATHARGILKHASAAAQQRLVTEALGQRERNGLAAAEELLGRRLVELLVGRAQDLQWFQIASVARRLAAETDPRSREALATLAGRPDERSRLEVAKGLADTSTSTEAAIEVLTTLASDPVLEVSVAAVRSLGVLESPQVTHALGGVFERIDADGKDFPVAREIIATLARSSDGAATEVLTKIAGRRALIKRGHFAELRGLAANALASRDEGGARP